MQNETNGIVNTEEKNSVKKESQGFLKEVFKFALIAFLVVIPIRVYIAQPFIVSGASMDPTFESGDYLIIDEISYRFNEPERGDVVVFKFPQDESKFFIKRIIGLPGETINVVDGEIFIEALDQGKLKIEEDYIVHKSFDDASLSLGDEEYFVMGDNRPDSLDSRSWGALPKDLIKGRAFLKLLPITDVGIFPGKFDI